VDLFETDPGDRYVGVVANVRDNYQNTTLFPSQVPGLVKAENRERAHGVEPESGDDQAVNVILEQHAAHRRQEKVQAGAGGTDDRDAQEVRHHLFASFLIDFTECFWRERISKKTSENQVQFTIPIPRSIARVLLTGLRPERTQMMLITRALSMRVTGAVTCDNLSRLTTIFHQMKLINEIPSDCCDCPMTVTEFFEFPFGPVRKSIRAVEKCPRDTRQH
jgi:hypothetical protein